jgi:hypothetical protein
VSETEQKTLAALHAEFGEGGIAEANAEWATCFETWEQVLDALIGCALENAAGFRAAFGPIHYQIARRLQREYFQRVGQRFFHYPPPMPREEEVTCAA